MAKKSKVKEQKKPERLMLGYLCIREAKTLQEEISILDRLGLNNEEIAAITGKEPRDITNARYERTRAKKTKGSK